VRKGGLFLDLSKVEWFDIGAIVHLCLLVHSALRENIAVTVALPLDRARSSEELWMRARPELASAIEWRIRSRRSAKSFANHLRFTEALLYKQEVNSTARLTILTEFDASLEDIEELDEARLSTLAQSQPLLEPLGEHLYQYCFPLTWISIEDNLARENIARFLTTIIAQPGRGN